MEQVRFENLTYDPELSQLLIELCQEKRTFFTTQDYPPGGAQQKRVMRFLKSGVLTLEGNAYALNPSVDKNALYQFLLNQQTESAEDSELFLLLEYELAGYNPESDNEIVRLSYSVAPESTTGKPPSFTVYHTDIQPPSIQVAFTIPEGAFDLENGETHLDIDTNKRSRTNRKEIHIVKPGTHDVGITIFVETASGYQIRNQSIYEVQAPKSKKTPTAQLTLGLKQNLLTHTLTVNTVMRYPTQYEPKETSHQYRDFQAFMANLKPEEPQRLKTLGEKLATCLPTSLLKKLQATNVDAQLKLFFEDEIVQAYPWESLCVNDRFIFETLRTTRATRAESHFSGAFHLGSPVIFLANYGGTRFAEPAAKKLAERFNTSYITDLEQFKEALEDASLIHIFGHHQTERGSHAEPPFFKTQNGKEFRPSELPRLREKPLVILANCTTEAFFHGKVTNSWSSTLLDKGAGAVIATHFQVTDEGASMFADKFYEHFLAGASLGEAFYKTTQDLTYLQDKLAYVLYGHYMARYQPGE